MKIIILSFVYLFSVLNVFAQQLSTTSPDRAYYLKKSNTQKVFVLLLLGGGIGMVIAGSAISDTYAGDYSPWLEVEGGVMAASSIPFFVASSKTGKKLSLWYWQWVARHKQFLIMMGQLIKCNPLLF